ncbi:HAD superfamily [Sesbania bispinosa]|nr:HAD superfamily [Sesbania bispinosa]
MQCNLERYKNIVGLNYTGRLGKKLQGSGFEYMFDLAHKVNTCKPLLVALTRTYQPQSGLFLFGEHQELELFFSLQDIFRITGLPIDGESVSIEDVKLKVGEFGSLTGLECDKPVISLQTLVDAIYMSYDDVNDMDEVRLNQICRIVALLGIGCMIMQETKSTIKIKYICLLRKVECKKDYAWGAAAWANLHSSLIEIKKGYGTQLYGSAVSLMVFALVRIPRLIPYVFKDRGTQALYNLSFPMMIEFSNIIGRDEMVNNYNQTQTSEFEVVLMTLTGNDELGYSVTTTIADSFTVKHQPHLAPRQFPLFNPRNKMLQHWNLDPIIDAIMGDLKNKSVFCWDGSHCTNTNHYSLHGNKHKKIVFKELKKIWEDTISDFPWEKGIYNESNTLLLDDSPYKGLCNPPFTSVFPHSFTSSDENDYSLGDGGDLRTFLEGLANAENMRNYIQENAFGQPPITETSQECQYYQKVLSSLSTSQV